MAISGRISMKRDSVVKCLKELDRMRRRDFILELDSEPTPEERAKRYYSHANALYDLLKEAMPRPKNSPRRRPRSKSKTHYSRRDIYKEVTWQIQQRNRGQYQITPHKINSILDEITKGREKGEYFYRVRENPPWYMYKHGIIEDVIDIIRKQGISANYLQKRMGLTQKTYYTFIKDLCYDAFHNKETYQQMEFSAMHKKPSVLRDGCAYLPSESPIVQYLFNNYIWDDKNGKARLKSANTEEKRTHYRFPLELCNELIAVQKAKKATKKLEKRMREKKQP